MKARRGNRSSLPKLPEDGATLQNRLAEAEEALRAIRAGEVDAVLVDSEQGPQVFTLDGAGHAYRVLIESMNEGALTITADKMILYANQCFARMLKCPLEKIIGGSFRRFLTLDDRAVLRPLLRRVGTPGTKVQMLLIAGDNSRIPVQISIRPLGRNGSLRGNIGMVVTDMTEAHRTEEMLRALTHRVVQVQEAERERVAFELHDNITQLICGALFRSQALAKSISPRDGASKNDAVKLREMLGKTADEVERITHNLGPNVLEHLGLVAALGDVGKEFKARTGVPVKLVHSPLPVRLGAEVELAFLRILQEALRNAEKHAAARHILVRLSKKGECARLSIKDDGAGFNSDRSSLNPAGKGRLGLLSMRERATSVGGTLTVRSVFGLGTEIVALVPLIPRPAARN